MNSQIVRSFVLCMAVAGLVGCETASQVNNAQEPQTPSAPAVRQTAATEPGPQDPDAPTEFATTESGLKYRILRQGSGPKPTAADEVEVHYKGWLDDGTVFDSSYDRGQTTSFPLLQVIPGWTEGMQLVGEGGMIELEVPSELGYGSDPPTPKIPPNSTLHFLVELIAIR